MQLTATHSPSDVSAGITPVVAACNASRFLESFYEYAAADRDEKGDLPPSQDVVSEIVVGAAGVVVVQSSTDDAGAK